MILSVIICALCILARPLSFDDGSDRRPYT